MPDYNSSLDLEVWLEIYELLNVWKLKGITIMIVMNECSDWKVGIYSFGLDDIRVKQFSLIVKQNYSINIFKISSDIFPIYFYMLQLHYI